MNDMTSIRVGGNLVLERSRRVKRRSALSATALCLTLAWALPASAQKSRVRELSYDSGAGGWVETPPPPAGTPAGDLHRIQVRVQEGAPGRALRDIRHFIRKYGVDSEWYPDALLVKAQTYIALSKFDEAHAALLTILDRYGGGRWIDEALRLELVTAEAYLAGAPRKVLGLRVGSGVELAYSMLDRIAADHVDRGAAEYAVKIKADHLFRTGEFALAEIEYDRILKDHSQSRYVPWAMRRIADATLAGFRGIDYDDSALIEARERYEEYMARFPGCTDGDEVRLILRDMGEKQAAKVQTIGNYYERTDHLASAVYYYQSAVRDHPDTLGGVRARRRLQLLGVDVMETPATPAGDQVETGGRDGTGS